MISENNENDGKSHKLDDDCGGVDGGVRSIGIEGASKNVNPMPHQDVIEQSLLYYASTTDSSLQKKYQAIIRIFQ
ncbi:hypothetical protein RhiirA5_432133 [Rhizophagus irregularis]|uniref:Uncharacterized protein n=1 Tax=Rhizophagus irregularis TaxID=588596 RepID=A0A2N0NTX4_9GLOM|nr:hypothetical protein RhiirA5_432133 [Rhizophagus irregularis]